MPFAHGLGWVELVIILVVVMIVFGVGRLPEVGGAMGKAIRVERFEEAHTNTLMRRKFVIDNSDQIIEETFSEFVEKIEHHMTEKDRLRILLRSKWLSSDPLA